MANKTFEETIIFEGGKDFNSNSFRIPFLAVTKKGTIIAGSDIRYTNSSDYNQIDIGIARSEDGGKTWIDKQIVLKHNNIMEHSRKMDGCIVVDYNTGRIFIFALSLDLHTHLDCFDNKNQSFVYIYSEDDGKTWSKEFSLKNLYDEECILLLQGPGSGIQLKDGTLVVPVQRWVNNTHKNRSFAGILYSKDGGESWNLSKFIDTYTSESAILEAKENEIIISCRSPLTNTRGFYKTTDLGESWKKQESHNTILEFGGCQSSFIKFTAPNKKEYALHTAPQHFKSVYERNQLTLMCSEDYINWNKVSEIIHTENFGYSSLAYNNLKNELYILTEYGDSIRFFNLTCLLPTIMQNSPTYDIQAISKISQYPSYSQGHYFNIKNKENWYKVLDIKLKEGSFCLINLNFLGFNTNTNLEIKLKQDKELINLDNCNINKTDFNKNNEKFCLIPIKKENDYFIYQLFYKQNNSDTLSISVLNSLCSHFEQAKFKIYTNFQDTNIEDESIKYLPNSYNNIGLITI